MDSRYFIYVVGFAVSAALNPWLPLSMADWLIDILLVWIASIWGSLRELRMVAGVATVVICLGLWVAPAPYIPLWLGAINHGSAILLIWIMVHFTGRRRAAEAAEQEAAARAKILEGLLPMCAQCKSIRDADGNWDRLETYLTAHSEARLTHTYCPDCGAKFLDGLDSDPADIADR